MFPNTTQIPNNLFNGEMQKMKDTELRITLIVARKTLGWLENIETGMRKEEDWISHSQLTKFTGRTSRALSTAIESCIKRKWIEARSESGEILDTKEKRAGKKIYYRLGRIFLSKIDDSNKDKTSEKSKEVKNESPSTSEKSSIEKSSIEKSSGYKSNIITKLTHKQNTNSDSKESPLKRKDFRVNNGTYKELTDAYQQYKGIRLEGAEFGEVKRAIKTMFYSGRTQEDIINFMKFCHKVCEEINNGNEKVKSKFGWFENWTILTIKRKLPEFLAGKFNLDKKWNEI